MSTTETELTGSGMNVKAQPPVIGGSERSQTRLRLRVVLVLLVLAVAPFLAMAYSVGQNAEASQREKLEAQTLLTLQTAAARLNTRLYQEELDVEALAARIGLQTNSSPQQLERKLPKNTQLRLANGRVLGRRPSGPALKRSVVLRDNAGHRFGVLTRSIPLNAVLLEALAHGAPVSGTRLAVSEGGVLTSGPSAVLGRHADESGQMRVAGATFNSNSTSLGNGRRLHVLVPEAEVAAALAGLRDKLLLAACGVLLALLALLVLVARPLFTELRALHSAARRSALDALTGLPNRRAMQDAVEAEIARGERFGDPLSLVILDVDDFKLLNDAYGHPAGDQALREIAAVLELNRRDEIDVAARFGGEEFAILLPKTPAEGALLFAERLRMAIEQHAFGWEEERIRLTASLGVATYEAGSDSAALYEAADQALYRSKRNGKNRVSIALEPVAVAPAQADRRARTF